MAEITIARMQADLEAVRVAELYANHPLLRNMPVPHFRLPSVELDVPVAVKKMEEQPADEAPRGAPTLANARRVFDKVLTKILSEERIRLKPEQSKKLKRLLDRKVVSLTQPAEIAVDINRIGNELSNTASLALTTSGGPVDPKTQQKFEEKLKELVRVEFLKLRKSPTRIQVFVNTSEIREAGPSEVITRIHLKITEEAFEWITIESDRKKQDRLIIE